MINGRRKRWRRRKRWHTEGEGEVEVEKRRLVASPLDSIASQRTVTESKTLQSISLLIENIDKNFRAIHNSQYQTR